jgi:acetyltransferase-like isoleucine patch superfamily enzyme
MSIYTNKFYKAIAFKIITIIQFVFKPRNVLIESSYCRLSKLKFNIDKSSELKLVLGKGVKIKNCFFYVRSQNSKVIIKNNVKLNNSIIWFEDNFGELDIGSNTTIEGAHFFITEKYSKIKIGDECMLSNNIEFRTGDSHSIYDCDSNVRINKPGDITLENRIWVGSDVKILKGVNLPQNIVIATGSIVTKSDSFKSNSIYGGIPAKIIKENIKWGRER